MTEATPEKAAEAAKPWVERISKTASKNFEEVKSAFSKTAEQGRMKGFARVGAVGVGSVIALGALKGKDAEGNERSGLVRVGQAVLGTGMIAGGVLAGGR